MWEQATPQSRPSAKLFSSRRNWDSPNPSPAGECAPPPSGSGGEGHTRWRERGWESPNSNEGTNTVVLFIYTYFVSYTYAVQRGERGCVEGGIIRGIPEVQKSNRSYAKHKKHKQSAHLETSSFDLR